MLLGDFWDVVEIFVVRVGGMATVAGSVIGA